MNDLFNAPVIAVPETLSSTIKNKVTKDLNPLLSIILIKVFFMQLIGGVSTLFMCSQFGVSFFNIQGLRSVFLLFGEIGCMALCGSLFIGVGTVITMSILRPEEIRVMWRLKEIYYSIFSLFVLFSFYIIGSTHLHLTMFAAWFAGAFISSKIILSFMKKFKFPNLEASVQGQI